MTCAAPQTLRRPIELLPYYRILPVEEAQTFDTSLSETRQPSPIYIARGKGFGDGRHETTQLCLLALGYLLRSQLLPRRTLDFGAGNGILGIAAAKAGSLVQSVEIDLGVLEEARHNARLNQVYEQFDFRTTLGEPVEPFDLVAANILRAVLLEYASALSARVAETGYLLLSGLVATDVPSVLAAYRPQLPTHLVQIYERGEFRALLFAPTPENQG